MRGLKPRRSAMWIGIAAVLLAPAIAMRFTDAVNWTAFDFAVAGALLVGAGVLFELVVWKVKSPRAVVAIGVGLAAAVLVVWAEGAVGIF